MELSKENIINIFKNNFKSEVIDTELGKGCKLSPYQAFIFCSITGSGYLDNPLMPFTPKGLLKVFYNAMHYNFVTGLFDNTNLKHTPYSLNQAFPFLFSDDYKVIIPIEFNSDIELQEFLFEKISTISNPTQYIVMRVEISKKGNGLEPFMEYLANSYFVNKGFICENQIPLSHTLGSPDFGGYGIPAVLKVLSSYGVHFNGLNIIELAMLRFNKNKTIANNIFSDDLIVGEAKTSTTIMEKQLNKYLASKLFNWGIEIHPSKLNASNNSFGLLNIDNKCYLKYTNPKLKSDLIDVKHQSLYKDWLKTYVKLYLIANLSNDEFQSFYKEVVGNSISTNSDISNFVGYLSFEMILDKLKVLNII
ncbi:hypothetical protein [Pedobacter cryophilus]|uniref:Uncharacterized protein n=1 Tax=Pedobacter cryophilus TaxID=2571271 RepID=A0A4U1C4F0_9SPHI|nr:hypothetical protein [Pedobacter cryophilus]TKC00172.1 hypothetical protein FA046_00375 [Pedobacter cryophilus]